MRDEQAWRMIGEAAQRAIDEALADGQSSACVGVGEVMANVRAAKDGDAVQVRIDLSVSAPALAQSRMEQMDAATDVLIKEFEAA